MTGATKKFLYLVVVFIVLAANFLVKVPSNFEFEPLDDEIVESVDEPVNFNEILPLSEKVQKEIEINLTLQRMYLWSDGSLMAEYIISSGKKKTPTRSGHFSVISKYPVAEGFIGGIHWTMPYFLGIYQAGDTENGIHELPLANGRRESAKSLGWPISHGCIRLGVGDAEVAYNWTETTTPVWIHY